jgi:hypothetical protein
LISIERHRNAASGGDGGFGMQIADNALCHSIHSIGAIDPSCTKMPLLLGPFSHRYLIMPVPSSLAKTPNEGEVSFRASANGLPFTSRAPLAN